MARRPLVTGEGAKYVATGKKQQAANAGRSMVAAHDKGMANLYQQSQGNPSSGDHTPAPPSSTPQHLSGQQFNYSRQSMHPGGAGMGKSFVPSGQTTMHPGGGNYTTGKSSARPAAYSPVFRGNTGGSTHFGLTPPAAPKTSHWDETAFPGVLPAASAPAPRGNASTSATRALGGKVKRSRSVKQASAAGGGGSAGGGGKMRLAKLIPHPSRHAGKLASHLKAATGVK